MPSFISKQQVNNDIKITQETATPYIILQSNNIEVLKNDFHFTNAFIAAWLYGIAWNVPALLLVCPPLQVLLVTDGGHTNWARTLDHCKWARLDSCIGLSECFWEAVCNREKTRENDKQRWNNWKEDRGQGRVGRYERMRNTPMAAKRWGRRNLSIWRCFFYLYIKCCYTCVL